MRQATSSIWTLLFFVLLTSSILICRGQTSSPRDRKKTFQPGPVKYVSPDETFEVSFTRTPEYKEAETDDAVTTVAFTTNKALLSMVSVYFFKPDVQLEVHQYLRNYESRIQKERKRIEAESDVGVNGVPGKELRIRLIGSYEILRLFVIGRSVFEIKWVAANWSAASKRTKTEFLVKEQRFMDSFKILDNAR